MKLPLLENLKVRRMNEIAIRSHYNTFHADQQSEPDNTAPAHTRAYYHRTTVEIGYSQIHRAKTPEELILQKGTEAIMREVYQPISNELYQITRLLMKYGITGDDAPMRRIFDLIHTLEGRK